MHPHCSHNIPCWQTYMMMHLLTNMSRPGTENVPGSSMHYTNTFHLNTHNHIHTLNMTLHPLADNIPHYSCNSLHYMNKLFQNRMHLFLCWFHHWCYIQYYMSPHKHSSLVSQMCCLYKNMCPYRHNMWMMSVS